MIAIKLDTHAVRQLFPEGTQAYVDLQQAVIGNIAKDLIVKDTGNNLRKAVHEAIQEHAITIPSVKEFVNAELLKWLNSRGWGYEEVGSEYLNQELRKVAESQASLVINDIISDVIKVATDKAMKDIEYKIEAATQRIEKIIVDRVNQSFASIIDQAVAEKIKKAIPGL